MIIVGLKGGIGNQLFQYAAGRALAAHRGVELRLDISAFDKDPLREYELGNFAIAARIASAGDISTVTRSQPLNIFQRFLRTAENKKPYYRRRTYNEPHSHFDNNFFKAPGTVYLSGYWQSERYFQGIADSLRKELQVTLPLQEKNAELAGIITSSNSVCVHIRRGDYVDNPVTNRHHGTCSPLYYSRCIEWMVKKINNPCFFVFSDDIGWAKEHITRAEQCIFVDHNAIKDACQDLRLMSLCKHHIIANSTFSWWGAWLNANQDKKVLVPVPWFNTPGRNTADLIPEGWIPIEAR